MTSNPTAFDDALALGEAAAALLAEGLERAPGGHFVLGCPAGRTPRSTFGAFRTLAADRGLDLSAMRVVLMDEYVGPRGSGWRLCPAQAHYSCRGFIERELRTPLNDGLAPDKRLPAAHVHVPDPNDPPAYERLIASLGGIDLFLLASGASDGHVGFNPVGTPLAATTRVVALAETTRQDNMSTFPGFRDVRYMPTHGVSVGPGTIVRWSRTALLLLIGETKAESFRRVTAAEGYDAGWPASVVHACRNGAIFADRAAAGQVNESGEQGSCGR